MENLKISENKMNLNNELLSEDQKDILQEIMNIAFGNATADLADVIDIYVELSVPAIELINTGELSGYIDRSLNSYTNAFIISQKFLGDFNGHGLFVFPNGAGHDLVAIIEDTVTKDLNSSPAASLEKEIIMEIGNILIGACVGKISELLNTAVIYSPPKAIIGKSTEFDSFIDSFVPLQTVIAMKTVFKFLQKDINGFIVVLTDQESIKWLKTALDKFMESYQ
ncbi:MAG: chemotaxis protein CheC [Chitinispirillaceae bacterium]|nr:chemotaxis protein CheC [Chitinispirillaceae bacterium]